MDDEIRLSIDLPRDSDGFIRRECPNCEHEFKWFAHEEGDPDAETPEQYFCPLCGTAAGADSWWTTAQLRVLEDTATPQIARVVQDHLAEMFRGSKGLTFTPDSDPAADAPTPDVLHEPDDMHIVEPPCHPHEPLKVPDGALQTVHCPICGHPFST